MGTTRRTVLAGIGASLTPKPLLAQAPPRERLRRLGVLAIQTADDRDGRQNEAALVEGLSMLDWHEASNLHIDWRRAGSNDGLYKKYAAELVSLGPNVLVAQGTPAIEALRRQTNTIPIVFLIVTDPVGQGFVTSLARPGGTITGFSNYDPPMSGKWLQMLTEINPPVAHVAVVYNPATAPYAGLYLHAIEAAAPSLALAVRAAPVENDGEIEAVMAAIAREERGGLLVLPDNFTSAHREAITALALRYRLPGVYPFRNFAGLGGLMSYGVDPPDLFRRSAGYIDLILKGAKPGDLPIQRPIKFQFVINLKTANALGITVPQSFLARVDELIE